MSEKVGLYLVCYFVNSDERLTAQGMPNVRLGVFADESAELARLSAFTQAIRTYPPEHGYTGHEVYMETAPLEFLREVLPFAVEIEPYTMFEVDHGMTASDVEDVAAVDEASELLM